MEKNKKNQKAYTKKRLNSIILLLAFAAIMLIVSTYAWFSTQKNVSITNLAGTVQVAEGMEISLDGQSWKQSIDLSEVDWTTTHAEYPTYEQNTNNIPSELQPVSTVGKVSGTMTDLTFYKGNYTSDGYTLRNVLAATPAMTDPTTKIGAIEKVDPNNSDQQIPILTSDEDYPGYYAFDVFIKNTIQSGTDGQGGTGNHTELQLNYDSFAKVLEKVTGEGNTIQSIDWQNNITDAQTLALINSSGVQNTIRVGFAVYDKTASSAPAAGAVVAATVSDAESKIRQVSIWEPNSAQHVDSIVSELSKAVLWDDSTATGTAPNRYNAWGATDKINTYGVTGSAAGNNLVNVYKWAERDSATANYVGLQNTVKTTPFERLEGEQGSQVTVYDYSELKEGITALYDTSVDVTDTETAKVPFWISTNATSRIRVFLWMEGQDVDTRNIASMGHGVQVNIDLTTGEVVGAHTNSTN